MSTTATAGRAELVPRRKIYNLIIDSVYESIQKPNSDPGTPLLVQIGNRTKDFVKRVTCSIGSASLCRPTRCWRIMWGRAMSSQIVAQNTEAAILARVIEADGFEITPDVAQYLLSMQLPEADRKRVDELSAKAQSGSLTETEESELDSYLHIGSLLGVMQSRARRLLKRTGSVSPQ
jgi:hypothetical protein